MRIVHLGKYYPPANGGIESFTHTLAHGQAVEGCDVRVVVVNHADAQGRDVTFASRARTPSRSELDGSVKIDRVGRVASLARFDVPPGLPGLFRKLLRDPPDIWHLQTPNPTMLLQLAAIPRARPLIVTHHSDVIRQRFLQRLVQPAETIVYRRASRILIDSPPYLEGSPTLQRHVAKVESVPLGINLTPFTSPTTKALEYRDQVRRQYPGPIWLSVGRLAYYKGFDVAIRALAQVPGTLLIVGTGPMRAEWQQLAAECRVADRIVWLGRVEATPLVGLYHAAHALWFPSNARSEAFGLAQVEAMASGCPVINTAIPASGVAWVSRDGETGLTVPVNDVPAFAQAARRLLEDPGMRDRFAIEARRQAEERFDERVMTRRTLDIYRDVLNRK